MVVIGHCLFYFKPNQLVSRLHDTVGNGDAAVVIFFVLSGFVLFRSLSRGRVNTGVTLRFYVQRIFRLYPMIMVATTAGLIYLIFVHGSMPGRTDWVDHQMLQDTHPGLRVVIAAYLGLSMAIIPPIWTVFVEVSGSLLIPIIMFTYQRNRKSLLIFLAFLGALSFSAGPKGLYQPSTFLVDFALGALIAVPPVWLRRTLGAQRFGYMRVVSSALALVALRRLTAGQDFRPYWQILQAVLAVTLLGTIVLANLSMPVLRLKVIKSLGDCSFSLYLIHFPVMCFVAVALHRTLNVPLHFGSTASAFLLLGLTLVVTFPLSWWSYRFIEEPANKLGKHLAGLIRFSRLEHAGADRGARV